MYLYVFFPETKGRSLEQVEEYFQELTATTTDASSTKTGGDKIGDDDAAAAQDMMMSSSGATVRMSGRSSISLEEGELGVELGGVLRRRKAEGGEEEEEEKEEVNEAMMHGAILRGGI